MSNEDYPSASISDSQKKTNPEYVLKGVQAFGIGVALFAASVAVAHAAISQIDGALPSILKALAFILLLLLNVVISAFGCMAVLLGVSMTGMLEVKQPIKIFDWAISSSWVVIAFAFAGVV